MTDTLPAPSTRQRALLAALRDCGDEMSGQQLHRCLGLGFRINFRTAFGKLTGFRFHPR